MICHFAERSFRWLAAGLLCFLLACSPLTANAVISQTAVVSTVSQDWSAGAHSVIDVDPVGGPRQFENTLLPTISDITVTAYKNYFYRIERFQRNNITKFNIAAPDQPVWQFSTLDSGEVESNPYDLIFVNDEKAYLLRYDAATAWIVNPSAADQQAFKIGELDLSAYTAAGAAAPRMNSAVIADGKLFVALQRLDAFWTPSSPAYVAVFDVQTDEEIDTGRGDNGLAGIALPIRNTGAIQYLEQNGTLYVQGVGDWGFDPDAHPSGIVRIDPQTYAVNWVVQAANPYRSISGMSIVAPDQGYFVGYAGWGDNTLYEFNPTDGAVGGSVNVNLNNINIGGMETGAYVDRNGMLWICDQTNARVVILDTETNAVDEIISTGLNPTRVAFTTEGRPDNGAPAVSSGSSGGSCFIQAAGAGTTSWTVPWAWSLPAILGLLAARRPR